MSDRKLDEVTGDFRDASGGAFEACDVVENQIAFSFMVPLGSWEGDPDLGHGFNELDGAKNTVENRNRLRDLAKNALKWLLDAKAIESVDVFVDDTAAVKSIDMIAFEVDYYLPGAQRPRRVGPFLAAVGGG